jgi:hypothetical protein
MAVTKSDYETARAGDAKVRQEFLDAVDLGEAKGFVKSVKYQSSSFSYSREGFFTAMVCESPLSTFFKIPLSLGRSDIVVYPESFIFSYHQFFNSLINHEGQHARQAMYHPYFYTKIYSLKDEAEKQDNVSLYEYLDSLLEVPALANELANPLVQDLTYDEKYNIARRIGMELENLHSYPGRNLRKDFRKIMCDTRGDSFAEKLIFEKDPSIFLLGK